MDVICTLSSFLNVSWARVLKLWGTSKLQVAIHLVLEENLYYPTQNFSKKELYGRL